MISQIQIFTICLLLTVSLSLHLQQNPNVYDPEQYQESLSEIQNELKNDLLEIQEQFKELDQQIVNAANDPYEKLRIYQEGIADERDSLYRIQQYLTLPFNERACQCINFTSELRDKLTTKIQSVNSSLQSLKEKTKECVDCGITTEIQTEIKIQEGYLQTMTDTLNAKCCQRYQILYTDNLNSTNWITGGQPPQEYKAWINNQIDLAQQSTENETLIRSCPISNPYSQEFLSTCTQCPENELFNIKTRQCETCPTGQIFNYEQHACKYNVTCPIGSEFNPATMICEKVEPVYNSSYCPPEAPVWNQQLLGCFRCNRTLPFYNTTINKCTLCPSNYLYNNVTNECRYPSCTSTQTYNPSTHKCEEIPTTPVENNDQSGTSSECPANRPYWDKESLSCLRCQSANPYYNPTTKNCENCPSNSTYNPNTQSCTIKCPEGTTLNTATLQCLNTTSVTPRNNNSGQVSVCPPSKPIWNDQTKSCSECESSKPYWNGDVCSKCNIGEVENNVTGQCEKTKVEINKNCETGSVWNESRLRCERINGSLASCPPDRPYYNPSILGCTFCPTSTPYYNEATQQCSSNLSQNNTSSNNTYNGTNCTDSAPLWDQIRQACVPCGSGLTWDSTIRACVLSTQNTSCPYNQQFNVTTKTCIKCLPHQKFNNSTKICESYCRPGETYNSNLEICSGTVSRCPVGLVFDQGELRCECAEGINYKYNDNIRKCEKACKDNEEYHYLDGRCYQI